LFSLFCVEFDIPGISNYPTIETKRALRTGAEEEYQVRGELGVFLKTIKKDQHLDLFKFAPKSFSKPFEIASYTFIRPHTSLKTYQQYSNISEVDSEFPLRFK
jgi:hypothetical protein